jgi:hypothetical protein
LDDQSDKLETDSDELVYDNSFIKKTRTIANLRQMPEDENSAEYQLDYAIEKLPLFSRKFLVLLQQQFKRICGMSPYSKLNILVKLERAKLKTYLQERYNAQIA